MGQQTSNPTIKKTHFSNKKPPSQSTTKPNLRHEGILRIARTPFENCQKIEIDSQVYFLENTKTNLQQLIKYKTRAKRYFNEEDVSMYTLAYLEDKHIPYPLLMLENIYVASGKYKLIPPETLSGQIYSKLKTLIKQKIAEYVPASPELIIASRCQEPEIYQEEILFKSLVLLEVCTLKSSSECYDLETYDILDQVVMERIEEIQGRYSGKIVRIVANMLDYDYEERMMPKDMSIWINRELQQGEGTHYVKSSPRFSKNQLKLDNAEMIKSRLVEQPSKSPKATTQKLIQPIGPSEQRAQMVPQRPKPRNSEQRISQIRNKIIKEKIKAQRQIPEQRQLTRSQKKKSTSNIHIKPNQRGQNRNLPNPYLNPNHLNKSTEKPVRNRSPYTPQPVQNKDLGIHDVKKLTSNTYGQKYSYMNQQEDLVSDRERTPSKGNFNLKYKYNISDDEGESIRLNTNRQKDGDRFVRVQKCIADFQRAGNSRLVGSTKKYDYGDILGECYENRDNKKQQEDQEDNRVLTRSPHRSYQEPANISDFSFEPPKIVITQQKSRKPSKQSAIDKPQQQQRPNQQVLASRQNYSEVIKKQLNLEKVVKNSTNYERHQQLYNDGSKPIKLSKQNEDILMIKKQIERSKKLIEEVKRNEMQNSS